MRDEVEGKVLELNRRRVVDLEDMIEVCIGFDEFVLSVCYFSH